MAIPKIIHYCFGMTEDFGGKPWSLVHYVCVMSAIKNIKPDNVFFYYEYEPAGVWWQLTKKFLTLVPIQAPREFERRSIVSPAHRADLVRLFSLLNMGGIYLDADVFVHRSFDALMNFSVVMGQEGPDARFGISNAVILAEPQNPFIRRWIEQYNWFRGGASHHDPFWNEHSVQLPHFMSRLFPEQITVLDHLSFFWPLWIEPHLSWLFESAEPIDLSRTFATHLWESKAWSHLQELTPGGMRKSRSNFAQWALPYVAHLPDDL